MTQNIYDTPDFFAAYSQLPRSVDGLDAAPEWPSIRAILPPVAGARVVDLGCGYGWFCRWARGEGAVEVLGLDVSERMLARAAETTDDPAIRYRRADLEQLELPASAFDLAYSSLTLHYIVDLGRLLGTVARALTPGGWFVFSMEHPIFTAPRRQGWIDGEEGRKRWPVDGYFDESARVTDWLAPGVVKQHRTMATTLTSVLGAGLTLTHVLEWQPSVADLAAHPQWRLERERPMFLVVAAQRPSNSAVER